MYNKSFCQNSMRVLFIQALRIPSSAVKLTRKVGKLGSFSAMVSSIIVFLSLAYIFGSSSPVNWVPMGIVVAPISLAPVAAEGWTVTSLLGLAGFTLGAASFPLDWPICWKEPPVANIFMYSVLSLAGSIMDASICDALC